ncbi:MAG: RluA family pseudouridine synthase [Candidatus Hydrogenedens sp.]|nr:RluA family pseudouridine synthase [Candidatus Hydrogenedentota bacterium]NLF58460.1 RluA family pseudouridine synthase [Candidatus Hydrogenedens sp.]
MAEIIESVAEELHAGMRLDVFLAEMVEDATRSFLKKVIKDGGVTINGQFCGRPARPMNAGDVVAVEIPEPPPAVPEPEDIPLDILYQDAELVIVNKPAGLVVHPAPGHDKGTLVNALLFHCPDFERAGADLRRPGIVHRLDRDTSGVMVAAKSQRAFTSLAEQAAAHSFDRRYLALVRGEFAEDRGRINAPLGRSLVDRGKMAVTGLYSRDAVTNVETLERFGAASLVALQLETGRTHQIRVHMRFAGRPVLGDPVYGVTDYRAWPIAPETLEALDGLQGQALHAERLGVTHPATGERMTFTAPPPADFQRALDALRKHAAGDGAKD